MGKRRSNNDGTIFKDSRGLWIAEFVLPDGRKKRKASKRQSVVKEWLQTSLNQVKQGIFIEDSKETVSQFFDRFLEVASQTLRPKTMDSYKILLEKHIKPELGNIPLKELRPSYIQNLYTQKLDSGLSKRTVQYIHAVLRRGLNQAVKWGLLIRNPTDAVTPPTPSKKAPVILSVDQIKAILDQVRNHRYYPIYCIAVGCGLREGEILGLRKQDLDLDNCILHVTQTIVSVKGGLIIGEPKSQKSRRSVAVPGFVVDALRDHLKNNKVDGLLFTTSSGRPISPRNLLRHFQLVLEKAQMQKVSFHSLRHSFASIHLIAGTNPKIVQEALGHSSISLTLDTYSHIIPNLQKDAAEKMDSIFKV